MAADVTEWRKKKLRSKAPYRLKVRIALWENSVNIPIVKNIALNIGKRKKLVCLVNHYKKNGPQINSAINLADLQELRLPDVETRF